MALTTLALFVTGMWAMILAVAAFLVIFVAPIEIYLFGGQGERLTISAVQAVIAILIVIALVLVLNKLKRTYLHKKLQQ
jgi:Na+/melibiose symporter-like transporter